MPPREPATERHSREWLRDRSERQIIAGLIVVGLVAFMIARACGAV